METTKDLDIRGSSAALWTGVLAGPLAQAMTLLAKYAVVWWACEHHGSWVLWALAILGVLICAFGAFESWHGLAAASDAADEAAIPARVQFMGVGGLVLNGAFALVIIAMAIPQLFIGVCE